MLVFFIHGVATRNVGYSKRLEALIREDLDKRDVSLPIFHPSFWGDLATTTGKLWNWVRQDLKELEKNYSDAKNKTSDIFRYQEYREGFISDFFGDILTYFNTDLGENIRKNIADHLQKFIQLHPEHDEIHLIAHSLGTVILWDVLFSERLKHDEPAFRIRSLLKLEVSPIDLQAKRLKSITTMGSPILFFNIMLDVKPSGLKILTETSQEEPFRWINIIHSSDIIAYPLKSSLAVGSLPKLFFRDKYIWADANGMEMGARTMGQAQAAMALGVNDGHGYYWGSRGVARLVSANLVGDCDAIDANLLDIQ